MRTKLDFKKVKEQREYLDITKKTICKDLALDLELYNKMEDGVNKFDKNIIKSICNYLKLDYKKTYKENFRETTVISFLNNKGGSCKTSTAGSLAYTFAELGYKVLCIDADMQGNLTESYNLQTDENVNIAKAILDEESILNYIIPTNYKNIDFVVYGEALAIMDMALCNRYEREHAFSTILEEVLNKGIYDFILIDTNPSLGILNYSIINATNYCFPPTKLEPFGLSTIKFLLKFINDAKRNNKEFKGLRFIVNNFDLRDSTTLPILKIFDEEYRHMRFDKKIRVDINVKKSQLNNKPILAFKSDSNVSMDYRELSKEILRYIDKI